VELLLDRLPSFADRELACYGRLTDEGRFLKRLYSKILNTLLKEKG